MATIRYAEKLPNIWVVLPEDIYATIINTTRPHGVDIRTFEQDSSEHLLFLLGHKVYSSNEEFWLNEYDVSSDFAKVGRY
jgi:hypothetical protein